MKHTVQLLILSFFLQPLLLVPSAHAQKPSDALPDFGGGYITSLGQEYFLGRVWLMSFRRQAPIYYDPILQAYVEDLLYQLAAASELKDRRLELVMVDDKSINAFAVPGGVVGINTGLLNKAQSEAQFTSVLTHELAHVSQRHFARGVESQQKASVASMAGMLAGVLMAIGGSADAGIATIMGTQAATMQNQLRYSRQNEQEADRIGMKTQVNAGMNPMGAEQMFKIMQAESRNYGGKPPEFLMTHPLTETRISDATNRALQYPARVYEENPEYQLMRIRVALSYMKDDDKAVAEFRERRAKGGPNAEANQYGLVLALTRQGSVEEAAKLLAPLREFSPINMVYGLAQVELLVSAKQYQQALDLLTRGLEMVPGNYPILMALAETHMTMGDYYKAAQVLEKLSKARPRDPQVWYLLAESQGKAGNSLGVHVARAEYFVLNGLPDKARQQLSFALKMNNLDETTRLRITERMAQVQQLETALEGF